MRKYRVTGLFSGTPSMRMCAVSALPLVLVAGCSSHFSSGVLKRGPDTYVVSVQSSPLHGGAAHSRRVALTEANEHCTKQGKEILVTTELSGPITVDLTFRCLAADDPGIKKAG